MSTVDDFAGRRCPYCGAEDSLDADYVMGEVACTECARVVAMGLEESTQTRYVGEVVFGELDDDGEKVKGSSSLSKSEAEALASGRTVGKSQGNKAERYANSLRGMEKAQQRLEVLCDLTGRGDRIKREAFEIMRFFVGRRKERDEKIDQIKETIAACVMLGAARCHAPIPVQEMRVLDPSLKDVEQRRKTIIKEVQLEEEDEELRKVYTTNLVKHYIRLLQMQMSKYERPSMILMEVIKEAARETSHAQVELSKLSEEDRCVMAVLLLRTSPVLRWKGKPVYDRSKEPPTETTFQSFAAIAHLNATHVSKIMNTAKEALPLIAKRFQERMEVEEKKMEKGGEETAVSGVKREREGE